MVIVKYEYNWTTKPVIEYTRAHGSNLLTPCFCDNVLTFFISSPSIVFDGNVCQN